MFVLNPFYAQLVLVALVYAKSAIEIMRETARGDLMGLRHSPKGEQCTNRLQADERAAVDDRTNTSGALEAFRTPMSRRTVVTGSSLAVLLALLGSEPFGALRANADAPQTLSQVLAEASKQVNKTLSEVEASWNLAPNSPWYGYRGAWCAWFVTYLLQNNGVPFETYVPSLLEWFSSNNRVGPEPRPGAVVFYGATADPASGVADASHAYHVGIVDADGKATYEGNSGQSELGLDPENWSQSVVYHHPRVWSTVVAYGYPAYPDAPTGGTTASVSSNIAALAVSSTGTNVFYRATNGTLWNSYNNDGWKLGPCYAPLPASTHLAANANGDHVFYFDSDSHLWNAYNSGGWRYAELPGVARAASDIATNASGTVVFYIESNGTLFNLYHVDGAWKSGTCYATNAALESPLAADAGGDHVFYLDSSNRVWNAYNSNGWKYAALPAVARAGSDIAVNAVGTNVFYVSSDGVLYNLYYDGSSWHTGTCYATNVASSSPLAVNSAGDHVFYLDSSNRVWNAYNSGGWKYAVLPATAKAGSDLVCSATGDQVFYVSTDGTLYNLYNGGSIWHTGTCYATNPS
jgi:hypothetical protein